MPNQPQVYYGADAIKAVEALEGPLTPIQQEIVVEEGFVPGNYKDDKGVSTSGVGQTGQFKGQSFKQTFNTILKDVRNYVPDYDLYPEPVRASLASLAYRGDLQQSPKFRKLLNQGDYRQAAKELLNNKEYKQRRNKKKKDGVVIRLEKAAKRLNDFADMVGQ